MAPTIASPVPVLSGCEPPGRAAPTLPVVGAVAFLPLLAALAGGSPRAPDEADMGPDGDVEPRSDSPVSGLQTGTAVATLPAAALLLPGIATPAPAREPGVLASPPGATPALPGAHPGAGQQTGRSPGLPAAPAMEMPSGWPGDEGSAALPDLRPADALAASRPGVAPGSGRDRARPLGSATPAVPVPSPRPAMPSAEPSRLDTSAPASALVEPPVRTRAGAEPAPPAGLGLVPVAWRPVVAAGSAPPGPPAGEAAPEGTATPVGMTAPQAGTHAPAPDEPAPLDGRAAAAATRGPSSDPGPAPSPPGLPFPRERVWLSAAPGPPRVPGPAAPAEEIDERPASPVAPRRPVAAERLVPWLDDGGDGWEARPVPRLETLDAASGPERALESWRVKAPDAPAPEVDPGLGLRTMAGVPAPASGEAEGRTGGGEQRRRPPEEGREAPVGPPPGAGPDGAQARPAGGAAPALPGEPPDAARPPRPVVEQVAERIGLSLRPGRQAIALRLEPAELGAVRIEAVLEGHRLSLAIRAEREPARELLLESLPRLAEALLRQGIETGRVTVELGLAGSAGQGAGDGRSPLPWPVPEAPAPRARPAPARSVPVVRPAGERGRVDLWV